MAPRSAPGATVTAAANIQTSNLTSNQNNTYGIAHKADVDRRLMLVSLLFWDHSLQ